MKEAYTFKLDQKLLKTLKSEAKKKNRSFNNYVETILIERDSPLVMVANVKDINNRISIREKV